MKNKKQIIIYSLILLAILLAILCLIYGGYLEKNNKEVPISTESTQIDIQYTNDELTGENSNYNAKINLNDENTVIDGNGVTLSASNITISKGGTYYITGSISNASIIVNTSKTEEVGIVLDNVNITSKTTSVINGIECEKLTITLADNSVNYLTDNNSYTEFTDTEKSEPDGTIFTKTDLVINGNGKLIVDSNYKDGIVSKDTLKIINSNIEITAEDDGIRGKDYVAINNSEITINSQGDGIKSTNDEDTSLGYIAIEGGTFNITSGADGIQAETILNISQNPNINITTNGEVANNNSYDRIYNNVSISSTDSSSSKALKAGKEITIENGTFTINSTDDSVHSNGSVIINNGTFNITSGDDGMHADTSLVINNGTINILKAYEGIESAYIEINGGDISAVTSDDGINVAGGNDSSSIDGRKGQNNFSQVADSNKKLVINGGNIRVNSEGDGLDSNGSMYIYGGNIIVDGPASTGNGALDYNGECIVNGGTLVVYGAAGMWQNPSNTSEQYMLVFSNMGNSGDILSLKDSNGTEIASITTNKSYGIVMFSSEKIKKGESYTLYVNGDSIETLTAEDIITGNVMNGMNGMPGGGRGMKMPR